MLARSLSAAFGRRGISMHSGHFGTANGVFFLPEKVSPLVLVRVAPARTLALVSVLLGVASLSLSKVGVMVTVTAPVSLSFFFNDTAATEIFSLSLHDALPIF